MKRESPLVSVVIPMYNVENYIKKCASSLFEQSLSNIEYIFVNDASTDSTVLILEKILDLYPNRKNQYAYSLFINTQCFIIKTVEIDTSNFKNDSKNGDLTYLTFVLVFKMRSICAFLTMFVLRSISISLCL